MAAPERIVIVGASLAGGTAALALREQGYEGELTLMGEETARPYERPPLSKALLIGDVDEPDWVGGEQPLSDRDIHVLRDTRVTRISPATHTVTAGGSEHQYDNSSWPRVFGPPARTARVRAPPECSRSGPWTTPSLCGQDHQRHPGGRRRRRLDRLRGGRGLDPSVGRP